jgi:Protein of unknown function (DUF3106)
VNLARPSGSCGSLVGSACLSLALALITLASAPAASAQPAGTASTARNPANEARPVWAALTVAQQEALGPLKPEWATIDTARKEKWLDLAARMPSMSEAERSRIQQRMTEWVRMSPAERGRARLQFQEARQLSPSSRQEQWEAYQALPADKRQALAAKAASPAARKAPDSAVARPGAVPAAQDKRNIVTLAPANPKPKTVGPTVVQARPGATTSLINTPITPPAHHQAGLPKVNAKAGFVDPATLLPRRGPQGAAAVSTAPASAGRNHSQLKRWRSSARPAPTGWPSLVSKAMCQVFIGKVLRPWVQEPTK